MSETTLERPITAPKTNDPVRQSFDFDRRAFVLRVILCACLGACSIIISILSWNLILVVLLLSIALPLTIVVAWFSALRLRMAPPVIVLDTNGIWDQRLEMEPIPWRAVQTIKLHRDTDVTLIVNEEYADAVAGKSKGIQWLPLSGFGREAGRIRIKLDEIATTLPEFLAAVDAVLPHHMQAPVSRAVRRRRTQQLVRPIFAGVISGMMVGLLIATLGASRQSSTIYRDLGAVKDLGVPPSDRQETKFGWPAGQQPNRAADARVRLGYSYHEGIGVPRDNARAAHQFGLAAADGVAEAQAMLGYFRENGIGVAQDFIKALTWYRRAAEQGVAWAGTRLALMYRDGRGVPRDQEKAFRLLDAAAGQGEASAQFYLGEALENGWGVAENTAAAIKWYRKAAVQGHANAEYKLGSLYRNGRSVPRNQTQAMAWFERSGRKGFAPAQYALGVAYELGLGAPRDANLAAFWYFLAEWHGHPAAKHRRVQFRENLSQKQQKAADAYRRYWLRKNFLQSSVAAKFDEYRHIRGPKAFAASMSGAFAIVNDAETQIEAAHHAMARCRQLAQSCLLYALGDTVVIGMREPQIDALIAQGGPARRQ